MANKKKEKGITKDMSFAEILQKKPEAAEILMKEGMHCFGCSMAGFETLEQGCQAHGIDVNKVIKKINKK